MTAGGKGSGSGARYKDQTKKIKISFFKKGTEIGLPPSGLTLLVDSLSPLPWEGDTATLNTSRSFLLLMSGPQLKLDRKWLNPK